MRGHGIHVQISSAKDTGQPELLVQLVQVTWLTAEAPGKAFSYFWLGRSKLLPRKAIHVPLPLEKLVKLACLAASGTFQWDEEARLLGDSHLDGRPEQSFSPLGCVGLACWSWVTIAGAFLGSVGKR